MIDGLSDFDTDAERYWLLNDPLIDVLATITFDGDEQRPEASAVPAVWTRTWGRGRVFASALGRRPSDLATPEVRALIERGLLWASR